MNCENFDSYVNKLLSEMEEKESETHNCECGCEKCGKDCPCDRDCECKNKGKEE